MAGGGLPNRVSLSACFWFGYNSGNEAKDTRNLTQKPFWPLKKGEETKLCWCWGPWSIQWLLLCPEILCLCLLVLWSHNSRSLFWKGIAPPSCGCLGVDTPTAARWWPAVPPCLSRLPCFGCWFWLSQQRHPSCNDWRSQAKTLTLGLKDDLSCPPWSGLALTGPTQEKMFRIKVNVDSSLSKEWLLVIQQCLG